MIKNKNLSIALILFCIILYLIWSVLEVLVIPQIELQQISIDIIKEIILKIIIWLIPAIILIRHFNKYMYIKKGEIISANLNCLRFIPVFLLFTVYHFISAYVQKGQISISESFGVVDIVIAFSVGISEEMVFRGWLLNSTLNDKQKWVPVLINATMFLVIHFPIWIREGLFINYIVNGAFLSIIILSIIFSWTFIKSKSIIIPAALHMYWDFLCFLLYK